MLGPSLRIILHCIELGSVVQEEMSFKDSSYLELWWRFCWAERKHLCTFGRGHYAEYFGEIILNSDQWFRRRSCRLTYISYLELWQSFCSVE